MRHATSRLGALAVTCAIPILAAAQPVSTGWTYQGQLKDAGAPAGGDYDMIFVLYDAASGGSRVGPPLRFDGGPGNPPPVTIVDGLFTVELDFGAGIFTGDALWLQVAVRRTRVGGYSTLDPRQPLTAAPYALFALNGPGGGGGNWDLNGNDIFNNNSGNVGIGTTAPTDRLHVRGTQPTLRLGDDVDPGSFTEIKDAGTVQLWINKTNISGQVLLDINPKATDGTSDVQIRFFRETNTTGPKTVQFLRGNFSTQTSARIAVDGGDSFFQAHGGNLGIGTTAPAAKLHVAGVSGVDGIMFPDGTLQTTAAGPGGGLWSANGNDIYYRNGDVAVGTSSPDFNFHVLEHVAIGNGQPAATMGLQWTQDGVPFTHDWLTFCVGGSFFVPVGQEGTHVIRKSGEKLHFSVEDTMNSFDLTPQMTLSENGKLGIGETNPEFPIHIQAEQPYIQYDDTAGGSSWAVGVQGPSVGFNIQELGFPHRFVINEGGNVGIGTSSPNAKLHVMGEIRGESNSGTSVRGFSHSASGYGGVFGDLGTPGRGLLVVGQSHFLSPVGIGTNSVPSGIMLNVNGTARVDVLEIIGADLSEKFLVSEEVKPGMVMEIDPDHAGKLRLSRGVYNRRVAGVASGAGDIPTGAILGNLPGHEDAPPVALSGRVWVFCDASATAIELGDLLTTSETPGHAMAVRDFTRSPGATLGKAMTALAKGETGLVLVLVNLQ